MKFFLNGEETITDLFADAVKKYPDIAQDKLEETAKRYKKRVVEITKSRVSKETGNLIKGYKMGKLKGYGVNMEKEFRATAPHFHLIEHGHVIVTPKTKQGKKVANGGQTKGFVKGNNIVRDVNNEWEEEIEKAMEEVVREVWWISNT